MHDRVSASYAPGTPASAPIILLSTAASLHFPAQFQINQAHPFSGAVAGAPSGKVKAMMGKLNRRIRGVPCIDNTENTAKSPLFSEKSQVSREKQDSAGYIVSLDETDLY